IDKSVTNLSSLVVLAECNGHKLLLTGDARGDHIIHGLQDAKFIKSGGLHVDVLKVPHHGSDRDLALDFFQTITADHYVISADAEYDNPDADTLCWIAQARGKDDYTVHLTNQKNNDYPALAKNLAAAFKKFPALKKNTVFRQSDALSLRVDVGDPVSY